MAFQSPLIAIPKKTTQDVDWSGPIRQIIAHSYGEDPNNYAEECAVLQRCRQDAVRGAGSDQTARDLLYKYFGQLELLELRFAEIKVSFAWHDCFTEKLTTQTSLAFEKASIIHLIASVLSSLAQSPSRSDPEGLKRAYYNSRASAGLLTYINENFLHAPSTDLGREVVQLLIGITMAQATEIFTEKLIEEKKAPALVSRSANQCAAMYSTAVDEMKEFQGKGVFDRNWLYVLQIKAKLFASFAQYYRSIADSAAGKHGQALVRIKLADTLAQEAQRQAGSFAYTFVPSSSGTTLPHDAGTSLQEITKAHATSCSEAKIQATKDNDLIYHEVLPSEAALPSIDKLPAAAPITIQEVYGNAEVSKLIGPDIFIRLVPLAVHESASVYSEEKAKLVRAEVERVDISEGEIRAGLEHLGLPGQVANWRKLINDDEDADGDVEISGQVRRLADDVSRGEQVDSSLRQLEGERSRCERELRDLSSMLDNESRECERMRAKHAPQFTQPPSGPQTASYRSTIASNLSALSSAASSDSHLVSLWQSIQPQVNLLSSGTGNLEQVARQVAAGKPAATVNPGVSLLDLEEPVGNKSGLDDKEREELEKGIADATERLDRLNKIRKERDEVLKDLKEKIQNDDVSSLLLLNRRAQHVEPQLFASELEKFRSYQGRLAAAAQATKSLLQELEMLVRQIEKLKGVRERSRGQKDQSRRLRDWEQRLIEAGEGVSEIRAGLGKGLSYYGSLSGVVEDLRREIKGFIGSREAERNRMVSEIETRQRLTSPSPPAPPPVHTSTSASRGLEERLAALSVGGGGGGGGGGSSYSPSLPQPPRPISSTPAGLPPPPPQVSTPTYPPPPPPQPAKQSSSGSAYDFASLSSLPSAFSTSSPTTSSYGGYAYGAPPPSSQPTQGNSFAQNQGSSAYPPPPPAQASRPATQAYGGFNAQQSSYPSYPIGQGGQPTYARSSQDRYTSPPPPPPSQPQANYPSYAPPTQTQNQTYQSYPSHPPPTQKSQPYYPAPPSRPSYTSPPPPPQQQQQQQYPNYPPPSGYQSPPPQQQSQYGYPAPPPSQPQPQGQAQGGWGYSQTPQGGYQYR